MDTARKVLLVDDDPTLSTVFAALLSKAGYTVICAESAEQGLALMETHRFDAIISDLHMPVMDGATFLAHLYATGRKLPAILVTGSGELEEVHTGAPGVDAILIKPIVRNKLLRTLERVIALQKK